VDVPSEAGDRWHKNLTGFRGEEDIAFNADPPVLAGASQRITTLIPLMSSRRACRRVRQFNTIPRTTKVGTPGLDTAGW
jgi:hypothetical protein